MTIYNVLQTISENVQLKDFIRSEKESEFYFKTRPTGQFRFDISMHELNR